MFKRRKILLALIEAFDGKLDRLRMQKILFLLCREIDPPPYHFLPYKYGCFSFQANMDVLTLEKKQVITQRSEQMALNGGQWIGQLDWDIQNKIRKVKQTFGHLSNDELIRYTYTTFPYFAIKSTIAEKYLSAEELNNVTNCIPADQTELLLTLGYEGLSVEQYINTLVENNVHLLCDVRKNAMSMKYGYSKKTLMNACQSVGIEYAHYPDVGIVSDKRKNITTREDYEKLFAEYRKTVLRGTAGIQVKMAEKIKSASRAALLCFEKDPQYCHRSHLAEALEKHLPPSFQIQHANA